MATTSADRERESAAPAPAAEDRRLAVLRLGLVEYERGLAAQRAYAEARLQGRVTDALMLASHPPTLCTGVLGKDANVLIDAAERQRLGLPYVRSDRGGDVMYLGPGQVVGYPILSLAGLGLDPLQYLRALEGVLIGALGEFGIPARRIPGATGVWVGDRKIAGVAIKVGRGVTTHGFNLNVDPDLQAFRYIVTCGIPGREVTSMAWELGGPVDPGIVDGWVTEHFRRWHAATLRQAGNE